ncbi:MAG: GxxExxY protein [Planctomycetota bacterium]|nr:GxxExxY protein [Planctomycetota bacterium]
MKSEGNEKNLIYWDLSYRLVGDLHEVHNKVGPVPREQSHQNAYSRWLTKQNIAFVEKPRTKRPIFYKGREVLALEPDFDIEGKIILELKSRREGFVPVDKTQSLNYCKLWDYRLGLLVNMGQNDVMQERLPFSPAPYHVEQDYSYIKDIMTDSLRDITEECRQSLLTIHKEVGVGYTANIYREMLLIELAERGLSYQAKASITPTYDGMRLAQSPVTSVLVDNSVLVEVTALNDKVTAADVRVVQA